MIKAINRLLWVIETMLVVIITITVFIVVFNFYQLKILKKDYVNFFGYSVFEVISNSMAPTIKKKDVIVIKKDSKIEKDNIITFKQGESFVTHRVIGVRMNDYLTKGDSNNSNDKPVDKKDVIGEVVVTFKNVGLWRDVITSPQVLISLIVTLGLLNYGVYNLNKNGKMPINKFKKDFKISYSEIIEGCSNE